MSRQRQPRAPRSAHPPRARGEHDHGEMPQGRIAAYRTEQADAVELGHHHVAQQHVSLLPPQRREGLSAIAHRLHVTYGREEMADVVAHIGVVVGHDTRPGAGRGRAKPLTGSATGALAEPHRSASSTNARARPAVAARLGGRREIRLGEVRLDPSGIRTRRTCCPVRGCSPPAPSRRGAGPAPGRGPGRSRSPRASGRATPSTRWNRSKMRGSSPAGMPVPVSRTDSSTAADGPEADDDLPLEGELEGVGDQVQDDLLPHVAVHEDRLGQGRAVDHEPQPGLLAGRPEVAGELRGQRRQVGRLVRRPGPARLDPREVQQGVDQLQQPQSAAVGRLQPLALARGSGSSASARASSTGPSIRVSGVRNSWLTFEKNAVFARSISASASARRRSASYARASARPCRYDRPRGRRRPDRGRPHAARADAEDEQAGQAAMIRGGDRQDHRGSVAPARASRGEARRAGAGPGPPPPARCGARRRAARGWHRPRPATPRAGAGDPRAGRPRRPGSRRRPPRRRRRWPRTGCRAGPPRAPAPPRRRRPDGARLRRLDAELAERLQPPGPDHLVGDLGAGAEDALDRAAVGREDRAVRKRTWTSSRGGPARRRTGSRPTRSPPRCGGRPRASARWCPRSRPRPPAPAARGCSGAWPAEERDVGVVVEDVQVRPPPDHDGEAGGEHYPHDGLETLRPLGRSPERRALPCVSHMSRAISLVPPKKGVVVDMP